MMGKLNSKRKKINKSSSGFSKYNKQGLVTYSESIDFHGNLILHYYDYDDQGRRTSYIEKDSEGNVYLKEITSYLYNGNKCVQMINFNSNILIIRYANSYGRDMQIKTIDLTTGLGTLRMYNSYKDRYDEVNIREVFIPYGKI